jgi:hypothetical protein
MKIYVRERTKTKAEGRQPRFRVLAVAGGDISFKAIHLRKKELEQISEGTGAEIVYLTEEHSGHGGKRKTKP